MDVTTGRFDAAAHGPALRGSALAAPVAVSFSPAGLRVFPAAGELEPVAPVPVAGLRRRHCTAAGPGPVHRAVAARTEQGRGGADHRDVQPGVRITVGLHRGRGGGLPLVLFGLALVLIQKWLLGNQTRFVTHAGKAFAPPGRRSIWASVTLMIYALLALVIPLVGLIIVSLTPYWSGSQSRRMLTLANFRALGSNHAVVQSVVTSVWTSLVAVVICIPIGYAMATLLVRGKRFRILALIADLITALPLGIPAVIFGVGFLLTYTEPPLILYGTRTVIVLVYIVLMLPFETRMQITALLSLGDTYSEASATSGASPLITNLRVTLPLMRSTILSAIALMFILLTHEFAASLLVRASTTQVMGTLLYDLWQNDSYPLVAAMALLMTAVTSVGAAVAMLVGGRNVLSNL